MGTNETSRSVYENCGNLDVFMSQKLVAVAHDQRVATYETKAHKGIYCTYMAPPQSNTTIIDILKEHRNLQKQRKSVGVYAEKYERGVNVKIPGIR